MAPPSPKVVVDSLSSLLDGTLGKIDNGGKSIEDSLKLLEGRLINTATAPIQWRHFQECFAKQVAEFTEDDEEDDVIEHANKKTKHSKEVLMSSAWEAYQSSRKTMAKRLRKKGEKLHSNGQDISAYELLKQSVEMYPCDSISRLKLAERQRDISNLVEYETTLRDCITVTGLTAIKEKEVSAGWSALGLLSLLLCQQAREKEARECLLLLGFQYRLSRCLLNYDLPLHNKEVVAPVTSDVKVLDNALSPHLLEAAYQAFNPSSSFWFEHRYHDPGTGYFSYVMPLDTKTSKEETESGLMDKIVETARELARDKFPLVDECEAAEWWAHCRCHASGHQMHFDSAFEVHAPLHFFLFCLHTLFEF